MDVLKINDDDDDDDEDLPDLQARMEYICLCLPISITLA